MKPFVKIGTRESQLALWQAKHVQSLLLRLDLDTELVGIKSDGDMDTLTPLYELGVQGVFTRALDSALLNGRIDIAVHSMKDVPLQLATGLMQAAVLKRGSFRDILVFNAERNLVEEELQQTGLASLTSFTVATSSIRRRAQWKHRYPAHKSENLRGNVNTRLKKLKESNWNGAIFAAAGLERIGLRPDNSMDLDWMLPAPAQGAIMVVCREGDRIAMEAGSSLNDPETAWCTRVERDFLGALSGGCATPISALAVIEKGKLIFKGNVCSPDGKNKYEIQREFTTEDKEAGRVAALELLKNKEVKQIISYLRDGGQ